MANPTVIEIPEWQWVKVAEAKKGLFLYRVNSIVSYYKTYRLKNQPEPTAITIGNIPDEAVKIFELSNEEIIKSDSDIDIYIMACNSDNDSNETGKILVSTTLNSIDIYLQDQTTSPLEWYLSRKITTTALTNPIATTDQGDYLQVTETFDITVNSVAGIIVGNWVEIWEGYFFFQAEIRAINGNVLTLYKSVGFPYTTNAVVYLVDIEQNKNFLAGGIGSQEYSFLPPPTFLGSFHINRTTVTMLHSAASDSSTYGDIQTGIPNGIIFKGRGTLLASETGLPKPLRLWNSLLNIRRNEDWESTAYDVSYQDKSGNPSSPTLYGTRVRKTFNGQDKSGVVIPVRIQRLEATIGVFRDDLSTLTRHRIKVMGHLVD